MNFKIELAGVVIKINCLFSSTKEYCCKYLSNENEEYELTIDLDDIAYERKLQDQSASDQYLETLALYRKIVEELIEKDIILFHSSVIEVDNEAYVFAAPSGTGKSTHVRLWKELLIENETHIINDDKPLIKFEKNGIHAYGTPWSGKERLNENRKAIIKGICFLEQSEDLYITNLSKEESMPKILRQTYRSKNREKLKKTIELLQLIPLHIPLYNMGCNISYESVLMAYEQMSKGKQI